MLVAWSLVLAVGVAVNLLAHPGSAAAVFVTLGRNLVMNGFSEEFLFRGALQSRLERLIDPAWALVLASLVFGLWHSASDASRLGHDFVAGAALGVVLQSSAGIGLGFIYLRTRSLYAGTVVHVLINTPGG